MVRTEKNGTTKLKFWFRCHGNHQNRQFLVKSGQHADSIISRYVCSKLMKLGIHNPHMCVYVSCQQKLRKYIFIQNGGKS